MVPITGWPESRPCRYESFSIRPFQYVVGTASGRYGRTIGGDAIQFRFGEDLGHMAAIAGELQQLMDRVAAWQMRDAKEPLIVPPGPGSELVPQEIYIHRR